MKRFLAGLAAGVLTGTAAAAAAAVSGVTFWATHAGVTCGFGTGPQGRGVACIQTSQKGYGATVTHTKVAVWQGSKLVFSRAQPR